MRVRSLIARPVRWALAIAGYDVIWRDWRDQYHLVSRDKFGYDALLDIDRLSKAWGYSIDLFFDVGAHEGQTIRRAQNMFKNCRIIAFEPHPGTFLKLKENMKAYNNVDLINLALGSKTAETTMFEYSESELNSLVSNSPYAVHAKLSEARQIQVSCTTIDKFSSEHGIKQIDALKIDTEGLDLEVIKGARSMLRRRAIKFIYFEMNDIYPRKGATGGALAPIDRFVRPYGYRFVATYSDWISPNKLFLSSNALYGLPQQC